MHYLHWRRAYSKSTKQNGTVDKNHQISHKLHGTVRNWPMGNRFTVSYCDKESLYCLFVIAVEKNRETVGWWFLPWPWSTSGQLLSVDLRLGRAEKRRSTCRSAVVSSDGCKCAGHGRETKTWNTCRRRHFPLSWLCFVLFLSWDRWHEWRRGLVALALSFSSIQYQAKFWICPVYSTELYFQNWSFQFTMKFAEHWFVHLSYTL